MICSFKNSPNLTWELGCSHSSQAIPHPLPLIPGWFPLEKSPGQLAPGQLPSQTIPHQDNLIFVSKERCLRNTCHGWMLSGRRGGGAENCLDWKKDVILLMTDYSKSHWITNPYVCFVFFSPLQNTCLSIFVTSLDIQPADFWTYFLSDYRKTLFFFNLFLVTYIIMITWIKSINMTSSLWQIFLHQNFNKSCKV